jgi:hypothetical protein
MAAKDKQKSKSLTPRDKAILEDLLQFRALRTSRISLLHFPPAFANGKPMTHSNGQKRLRTLREEGCIDYIEQPSTRALGPKEFIYFLTQTGARALAEMKGCDIKDLGWTKLNKESTNQFLSHVLGVNDIVIAIRYALPHLPYPAEMIEWTDDAQMKKGEHSKHKLTFKTKRGNDIKNALLIPDAHVLICIWLPQGPMNFHFLIEWDTGSEVGISNMHDRNSIEVKAEKYKFIFQDGGVYEEIYGTKSGRLLFVTSSDRRLQSIKKIFEGVGGKSRFWFTTMDKILATITLTDQLWEKAGFIKTQPSTILTSPIWYKAGSEGLYSIIEQ